MKLPVQDKIKHIRNWKKTGITMLKLHPALFILALSSTLMQLTYSVSSEYTNGELFYTTVTNILKS